MTGDTVKLPEQERTTLGASAPCCICGAPDSMGYCGCYGEPVDPGALAPDEYAAWRREQGQELSTEQVHELLEGTTPGKWDTSRPDMDSFTVREDGESDHVVYIYRDPSERVPVFGGELDNARADAALMAAAPALAQGFLEHVAALTAERTAHAATRQELEQLRERVEGVTGLADRLERQMREYAAEAGHQQPNSRTQVHFAAMAEADRDTLRALRQILATAQEAPQ